MKTLILGLGNPFLGDDGVGIFIASKLGKLKLNVDIKKVCASGFAILDEIQGYDRLILIDSIKTKDGKPGDIYKLGLESLKESIHLCSPHGINLATAIEVGKLIGLELPEEIIICAVEVKDTSFREGCTPEVKRAIPKAVGMILGLLKSDV
jgi:hydrogenase maturation protease